MPYNVVFFGTSDFSVPSLEALLNDSRFKVSAVVTKPDSPVGRHQVLTPPPIKKLAQEHGIPALQLHKIKTDEAYDQLESIQRQDKVDIFVVVSYGKIIPQTILDLPTYGCINVHGSLLPRWRGASCVQSAIASGDEKSGVTVMLLDAEMDHGPILAQTETTITSSETGGELHDRLAVSGASILPETLVDFIEGKIQPRAQDHAAATYCRPLTRDDGKLDWNRSPEELARQIRAYNPWPGTWTEWDGKRIKIHDSSPLQTIDDSATDVGKPIVTDGKLIVKCGNDALLEILKLQPEGKTIMSAKDYLAGHHV